MNRIAFHTKAHYYLALLVAFCLPVASNFASLAIALLFLNWLIEGDFKNKFRVIAANKYALLFISFFILHLVALSYTKNIDSGLFDIQVKLSLLFFPLMLSSRPLTGTKKQHIFLALIAGGIAAALIMLVRATYIYLTLHENKFFYNSFSFLVHPGYLSMYLNLCIAWLLLHSMDGKSKNTRIHKLISVMAIVFFSFIIILLSSKIGLLTLILLFVGFLIYYIFSGKKYIMGLVGAVAIALSIYCVINFIPAISGRITTAIKAVTEENKDQSKAESTAVRLLIWKASNQVISENLIIGTAPGDSKDELMREYKKRGMTGAYEHNLNAHNQFYQEFIGLGLTGFILLLACFCLPLLYAVKTPDILYLLFLLIIIFNFLTESMLESAAGVMFFAFFNSLLCFGENNKLTSDKSLS